MNIVLTNPNTITAHINFTPHRPFLFSKVDYNRSFYKALMTAKTTLNFDTSSCKLLINIISDTSSNLSFTITKLSTTTFPTLITNSHRTYFKFVWHSDLRAFLSNVSSSNISLFFTLYRLDNIYYLIPKEESTIPARIRNLLLDFSLPLSDIYSYSNIIKYGTIKKNLALN